MAQKSLKPSALSHYDREPPISMLATWVNRWSMGSIVGAKVLDPNLRVRGKVREVSGWLNSPINLVPYALWLGVIDEPPLHGPYTWRYL